jgi:transcription termination factor NusB
MHAVWPSEWMTLERNEVLDSSEEIGGTTVPSGAWVQTWGYHDADLWSLVEDGILDGHSIGAELVEWEYTGEDPEDLPGEVSVPDDVDVDEFWQLTDGIILEVSAVDVPAVPDARILEASKARAATAQKRLADHLGNRGAFIEEAQERGHSEAEAERLWDVLSRAVNVEGAGEPGEKSLTSAAKSFLNELTSGWTASPEAASSGGEGQTAKHASGGDTPDDGGSSTEAADDSENMSNSDEPPEWAQELQAQVEEQSERLDAALDGEDGAAEKDADAFEEAPEWAKALKDDVDKQAERIDEISKQTGATESQQLGGAEKGGDDDGVDRRAAFFVPESKQQELAGGQGGR